MRNNNTIKIKKVETNLSLNSRIGLAAGPLPHLEHLTEFIPWAEDALQLNTNLSIKNHCAEIYKNQQ